MTFNPDLHHRQSIRLKNYDYSQAGLYFITICTQNKSCLFGHIQQNNMVLNDAGNMIATQWQQITKRFPSIALHEFVVMPNHFHAIIELLEVGTMAGSADIRAGSADIRAGSADIRAGTRPAPTVGNIVGAFKSLSTHDYIQQVKQNNWQCFERRLWQRNYHEHIIRSEAAYFKIADYVLANPSRWQEDRYCSEIP